MSVTNKYTIYCAVINGVQINQCKSIAFSPSVAKLFEYGSGTVDPQFAGYDGDDPIIRFSSTALKKLIANINPDTGVALDGTITAEIWFQKMQKGGTRQTGATALKLTIGYGIACLMGINGADGQAAVGEAMIYGTSVDGETSPVTLTSASTLPALAATDQLYTIGPAKINNAFYGGIESFAWDPKIQIRRNRGDGEPYRTFAYIARRGNEQDGPSVRLTSRHIEGLTTSVTAISSSTKLFLRSMKAGGIRETLAATKHISFTAAAGGVTIEDMSGRDGDEASTNIEVNGTGSPSFTIASDVAIA